MSYEAAVASFIIACEGATLNWLAKLPPNSIFSWEHLKLKVIDSFQGLSKPSLTSSDLFNCKQVDGETLTSYFRRFIQLKAQSANIPEETMTDACLNGLGPGPCPSHFAKERLRSVHELFFEMEKFCKAVEDHRRRETCSTKLTKKARNLKYTIPGHNRNLNPRTIQASGTQFSL